MTSKRTQWLKKDFTFRNPSSKFLWVMQSIGHGTLFMTIQVKQIPLPRKMPHVLATAITMFKAMKGEIAAP